MYCYERYTVARGTGGTATRRTREEELGEECRLARTRFSRASQWNILAVVNNVERPSSVPSVSRPKAGSCAVRAAGARRSGGVVSAPARAGENWRWREKESGLRRGVCVWGRFEFVPRASLRLGSLPSAPLPPSFHLESAPHLVVGALAKGGARARGRRWRATCSTASRAPAPAPQDRSGS